MKKLFATLILSLSFGLIFAQIPSPTTPGKTQNNSTNNTSATGQPNPIKVANEMCNCVNDYLDTFHPIIKSLVVDMAEKGEEEAQSLFVGRYEKLSAKEQAMVEKDVARLQDEEDTKQMVDCIESIGSKYSNMSAATEAKVLEELEKSANCRFTANLLKIANEDD